MKTEIRKGFKLFEMRDDQKLFPLFIGKNTETPMNKWVMAEIVEKHNGFAPPKMQMSKYLQISLTDWPYFLNSSAAV